MGFFKRLRNIGNADGTRDAIRDSYRYHYNVILKREGSVRTQSAHYLGLYNALRFRYKLHGIEHNEHDLTLELFPFTFMKENVAIEALAEYVVLHERPKEANIQWLSDELNKAFRSIPKTDEYSIGGVAFSAMTNNVPWVNLLDIDVKDYFTSEVNKIIPPK